MVRQSDGEFEGSQLYLAKHLQRKRKGKKVRRKKKENWETETDRRSQR